MKDDLRREFSLVGTTYYHLANLLERHVQTRRIPLRCTRRITDWAHLVEMLAPGQITPTIVFEVINLADDRIGVTARCLEPDTEAASWFAGMMEEIERYWPSVRRPSSPARERSGEDRKTKRGKPNRGMNMGTARRVAEVGLRLERGGIIKIAACELVGIDPKTYNRWKDEPLVLEKLEELKKKKQSD